MTTKTFTFVAGMDSAIPVALCLEYDIATQAVTMDDLPGECERILTAHVAAHQEEGLDPWTMPPPPADAVTDIRELPGAREFTVTLELP